MTLLSSSVSSCRSHSERLGLCPSNPSRSRPGRGLNEIDSGVDHAHDGLFELRDVAARAAGVATFAKGGLGLNARHDSILQRSPRARVSLEHSLGHDFVTLRETGLVGGNADKG